MGFSSRLMLFGLSAKMNVYVLSVLVFTNASSNVHSMPLRIFGYPGEFGEECYVIWVKRGGGGEGSWGCWFLGPNNQFDTCW